MTIIIIVQILFKTCERWLIRHSVTIKVVENAQTEGETDVHTSVVGRYGVVGHR